MRLGICEQIEGEGEQAVADQDRGCFIVGAVHGQLATAYGVVIHRRKVVMHQRIAVHALNRTARHKGALARHAEQRG